MIFKDSRYATGLVSQQYRPQTGTYQTTVNRVFSYGKASYSVYVWKEKDRIDLVTEKFLGTPHLWWKVMDYNPEIINPFDIAVGTSIRIPNVQ